MPISPQAITEFCALVDWAYQACACHRSLFDDNPNADQLNRSKFGYGFGVLSAFTLEYSLLQIVKLHDKATVAGQANLSVDYILKNGDWQPSLRVELETLAMQLESFASKLRHVRNKALSHNDLAAILQGGVLGGFDKDEDVTYFERLGKFANLVSRAVRGSAFAFNPIPKAQFQKMAAVLAQGIDA